MPRRNKDNIVIAVPKGQFDAGNHIGQGRIFYQVDELVAAAGQGPTDGLGQNYRDNGLHFAESERLRPEHLPFFDRIQGSADIFGMIGSAAQGKRDDRGGKRAKIDAETGQAEVPKIKLD